MGSATRIRLTVRYDGTGFAGSQVQPARRSGTGEALPPARTVSGTLKHGLEALTGQPLKLLWASRTDRGVHAESNVCAFDADLPFPVARLEGALNRRLPPDLRVRDAAEAPAGWHPRFSATAREYVYRIWRGDNAPYDRLRFTASYDGEWDDAAVSQARQALCGRHDFREFAKEAAKLDSTICDLQVLEERREDGETRWRLRANRFLRQMVCNLAGTLLAVAAGKVQPGDVAGALVERRSFKVVPAPPRGLVLMQVMYPPEAPGPAW